ncbi:sugar ABC transporter substrate-binding protein [Clostridium polyendosporum]|uniref:Sugar ABC transporter substrate-binding protein n=1 Tax=Clostridium polyendosporum TaxID=69208 RepID=A0A919S010_9CLOT|nr:sugar ABC transporter substrate-binding protein [Clostridium polyendosporum]GIM28826.1 sugar ABC transporter substrate-binding protein [Clostridium polyendosporum]
MGRKSKKLVMLTLIISLATGLVGCGSKASDNEVKSGSSKDVTLKVWLPAHSDQENATLEKIFKDFNKVNEGKIKAEYEFIPRGNSFAYEDKISAAVASNSLADVIMMDGPNISNYAYSGIIQPLDEHITKDDLSDFVGSAVDQGTYDGKLYALAPTESTVALFYNKEILDAAGIKPPTKLEDAWTWNQFLDAVKKVNQPGKVYGLNIHPDFGTGEWMTYMPTPFVWSNNGSIISKDGLKADGYINSPEAVEGMKFFQEAAKYANWQATPTEFEEGKAAFTISGSWAVPTWEKNYPNLKWGVTFFPYSKTKTSPSGDWSWGVSSKSKNVKEAAEFIKFVTNTDNVVDFAKTSGKPPAKKSAFDKMPEWDQYPRSVLKQQVLNTAHPRPKTPAYPVLTQEFAAAAVDIVLGADVKERLDKAAKKVDENSNRYFKK